MLTTSRPALVLLAAGCSLLLFVDILAAQTGTGSKKTTKKSQPVQPVEATDDSRDLEAPPPRAKATGNAATKNANSGATRKAQPKEDGASGDPPKASSRSPRPEMQPDRVEKLSPELETLLKDWEVESSKFKKLVGDFTRFKYDYTFSVEFRASGKFAYDSPDKGYYEFEGLEIAKGEFSRKKYEQLNPKTKKVELVPFDLKSDLTEHWVCDGKYVLKINDREKQYERVPIPPENQGQNIIDGPLPFLFGMKVDRAKRRYTFELMPPNPSPRFKNTVWLLVKPKTMMDASNWSEARVGIREKTFLPVAVMLTDPSGNSETVHMFDNVEANPKKGILPALFGGGDPFTPDLRKFKLVQNEKGQGEGADGVSDRTPAGTGTKNRTSTNDQSSRIPPRTADTSEGGTKSTKKAATKK